MGDLNLSVRTAKPLADNYNKGQFVFVQITSLKKCVCISVENVGNGIGLRFPQLVSRIKFSE